MLDNLTGWHSVIIIFMLVIVVSVVAGVIFIAVRSSRKSAIRATPSPGPAEQIKRLAQLRADGLLSDTEYEAKRAELLRRL